MVLGILLAYAALTGWAQSSKDAKSETLLAWQFAGTKHIATLKDLKTFQEIVALPETAALRDTAAHFLAHRAAARFTGAHTNLQPELARVLQPLLPDVWQNETSFLMTGKGTNDVVWLLGLKVDSKRSEDWGHALSQLAAASGMKVVMPGQNWTAQKDNYRLSFSRNKDWTIIEGGFGAADEKIGKQFRSDLGKRRAKQVLSAEMNGPLLAKLWHSEHLAHAPRMSLDVEPRGDGLRSELAMDYPQDLGIKVEKWNVPANIITEPLIGFTAIQGVQRKLETNERIKALHPTRVPNQLFSWAQGNGFFSIFFAADVGNPAEVITNTTTAFKDVKLPVGFLRQSTNRTAVLWEGLPGLIKPFLEVAAAPGFVRGGLFPIQTPTNQPAPPELFAQLKKKDVIYYEWESTGGRITQFVPIWQLYHLLHGFPTDNDAASAKWLHTLRRRMGNSVTEGTLDTDRRIKLVRQSQLGFNGLELVLLAHMIDDKDVVQVRSAINQPPGAPAPAVPAIPVPGAPK